MPPVRTASAGLTYVGHEQSLLRMSKLPKNTIVLLAEGVHISTTTARTLDDLRHQVTADRLILAQELLAAGHKLFRARPAQYRSAISRYYYCMYHCIRAVVFFTHGGDDYESHSALPAQVPADFTDSQLWRNALKDARSHRNDADYDPYPLDPTSWRSVAVDLNANAISLLAESESYLKRKGCVYV